VVSVIKRKNGKNNYYYLIHNAGKKQDEIYLGKVIPKNITELKREFLLAILGKKWNPSLDSIKKGHAEHLKNVSKTTLIEELREFSYYFTYDSQKIEGSTLTQQETYNLLRFQLTPDNKPEHDMIEAKLHHEVFMNMIKNNEVLSQKTVLCWHRDMFEKTKPEFAGKMRLGNVYVTNSRSTFPHWKFVPAFVKDFFKWYNKVKDKTHPVELAALAHFRFVNIHPFGDGNGRVSRLMMNNILFRNGYPLLNIRYGERKNYYKALETGNLKTDEIYFLKWFMKRYVSEYLRHYND
jgi:Fic family protein